MTAVRLPIRAVLALSAAALQAADVGHTELAGEHRVLAVGLLDPPPAGVPGDVEHR